MQKLVQERVKGLFDYVWLEPVRYVPTAEELDTSLEDCTRVCVRARIEDAGGAAKRWVADQWNIRPAEEPERVLTFEELRAVATSYPRGGR